MRDLPERPKIDRTQHEGTIEVTRSVGLRLILAAGLMGMATPPAAALPPPAPPSTPMATVRPVFAYPDTPKWRARARACRLRHVCYKR